ncbi:glycosyl transferase family 1 [Candidatus Termititenax dinenymphae]|uniref:Glycosyl transferase family 1 n=1 Tax=Candidatus Termititenax dinenymphae TaxID=2218523 RepID=A0A388TKE5_9BACT|nr:glycosyl transferase family 1 [Candidatus Termititenax dinenymphae]
MRIGMFTDTYTPQINGVVTSIRSFTEELQKMGHEVFIFAPKLQDSVEQDNIFYFKSFKYAPLPEHHLAYSLSGHLKTFKDLKLDILHSHTPFSLGWLALFFSKQYHIPLIHTYHTLFIEYVHYVPTAVGQWLGVWLSTNASRRYCQSCAMTVVPSEAMRKELQRYGVTNEIDVIPTGVNDDFRDIGDAETVLKKYNIDTNTIDIIAYAGRIAKEKNIEFLLHVYKEILKVRTHILFVVIGDGQHRPVIEKMAMDLGIRDKMLFTGYISDKTELAGWYKAAQAFVFSSLTETQGLVILEAMSVGTPVVAVDAMGISDIIHDNTGGFASKPDVSEFALKLTRLLSDKELHKQKSNEASQLAKRMSMFNMTNRLVENYQRLIDVATKV